MALKTSKYVTRILNAKRGIVSPNIVTQPVNINQVNSNNFEPPENFEEFIENNSLIYIGHYKSFDSYLHITSSETFIFKLLDIFEKMHTEKDLFSAKNAYKSKPKTLIGLPLNSYKIDGYSADYKINEIHDISSYIPKTDNGNWFSFRIQLDDSSDFNAFNTLTAIYYFHGKVQSIQDYLSYFPEEDQIINLKNTISRFNKVIDSPIYTITEKFSYELSLSFLPVFQAILLEKQMQLEIPLTPTDEQRKIVKLRKM